MSFERRKHYLINKPFQLRYMAYFTLPLLIIAGLALFSFYLTVWGSVLDAFSDEKIRNDFLTASRITEYEAARFQKAEPSAFGLFFKEANKRHDFIRRRSQRSQW